MRELKKKFALNSDCFLVKGAKRGAIYDLATGDIYSINEDSVEILDKCEKGVSVRQIIQTTSKVESKEVLDYFYNLKSLKLGRFIEKCETVAKISLNPLEVKLDFIWLELTQDCNLRCLHCYANSGSSANRIKNDELLTLNRWERVIQEAFDIGCRKLQFIGGEPMLFGKDIFGLIRLARGLDYELIELFTNATLLTEEDIDLLAKHNIQIATSIYSKRAEIHDQITGRKGSFEKTIENVKRLQAKGLEVRFATIAMRQNEEYIEETVNFLKELNNSDSWRSFDVVRPIGKGLEEKILPDKLALCRLRTKAVFSRITKEEFIRRKNGHSCWQGKLCVSPNGELIPCIMAREEDMGDIKKQTLNAIFEGSKLRTYWGLSKDKIEFCKDCEYRYACFDCRPLVWGETGSLYARGSNCLYSPYQGEWQNSKRKG